MANLSLLRKKIKNVGNVGEKRTLKDVRVVNYFKMISMSFLDKF